MQSDGVLKAILEQVSPPTPLDSDTADYVVAKIMKSWAILSKCFCGQTEHMDEVFIELLLKSRVPGVRQWWVQDSRLMCVSLGPNGKMSTTCTLGLTSVSRVELKMNWPAGIGKLAIHSIDGNTTVIRQAVRIQYCTPANPSRLAPRVRRFVNLASILRAHVM